MKLAGRWFVFLFFFTVDVRVKAANDFTEQPHGCLTQKITCALQSKEDVFHFSGPQLEFHMAPASLVLRLSSTQLEFAQGVLWVEKYQKMNVKTVYGDIIAKSGPFWILQADDKIWVRNVNGDLKIKVRDGQEMDLPIGFQIWIGGLDDKGHSTFGIPEIIPVEGHIRLWSQLFPGTKVQFKAAVESVKWSWGPIAEKASEMYTSIASRQRHIAEARAAEIEKRKLALQEERKMFRELYIKKAFWR